MIKVAPKMIDGFYTSTYTPENCMGYLIFIHGGPGIHSAYFEKVIEQFPEYQNSNIGWISYDQRGCGRTTISTDLTHDKNTEDLVSLYRTFKAQGTKVLGLFGHSYGALLARDAYEVIGTEIKCIIAGMNNQLTSPRNRSLVMDLQILKSENIETYSKIIRQISTFERNDIWKSAKLVRNAMKDASKRSAFYWSNEEAKGKYNEIISSTDVNTPDEVFRTVRATIYEDMPEDELLLPDNYDKDILWINGFHDFLMSGESISDPRITTFFASGHYPHIEEPDTFLKERESSNNSLIIYIHIPNTTRI